MKTFLSLLSALVIMLSFNSEAQSEDNDKNKNAKENSNTGDKDKDLNPANTVQNNTENSVSFPENNLNNLENAESIAYYYICTNLTKPEKICKEEEREENKLEREIIKREKKAARKHQKEINKGLSLQK